VLAVRTKPENKYSSSRSATEYVPWESEVDPGVLQTKRNDLMMLFAYQGTDIDGVPEAQIDHMSNQLEAAVAQCDTRVTVWCGAFRRYSVDYPDGDFHDEFAQTIDQYWRDTMQSSGQYANLHYIAFTLASQQAGGGIFERIGAQLSSGKGFAKSVLFGVNTAISETALEAAFISERAVDIQLLRDTAYGVLGGLPHIRSTELQGAHLLSALKMMVCPASPIQEVRDSRLDPLLDGYLADNEIDFPHHRHMRFYGTTDHRLCALLHIKDWPDSTVPGLLDALMALPMELTVAQTFKLLSRSKAESYIEKARAYNQQRLFNMQSVARAKLSKSQLSDDDADQGRLHNVGEANDALRVMRAERRVYGYYNITVAIYGHEEKQLDDNVRMADEILRGAGYVPARESAGMLSSWKATIPGMHSEIIRWNFANTGHFADLAFSRTIAQGEKTCDYFEEQTGRPAPALMLLPTEYSTPFSFSPLVGQVGHTFIFGPTGGGKTVLTNFMALQWQRYGETNIFRFDRDYSAYITTMLCNGDHVDLTSGNVKLCPWKLVKNPHHRTWLALFTKALLTAHGYEWKADDDKSVNQALDALAGNELNEISIEALEGVLPTQWLRQELAPWMPGGTYGHLFGSDEDNFSLSSHICIEMGNLLLDPIASPRLIDYFAYLIEQRMASAVNPVPTLIDIQEASFFLADPVFRPRIDTWLKTMRKKLGTVVMSMQSVQSATDTDIFASIGDNIPTRIFLPNVQAGTEQWREIYRRTLGLNEEQISRIARATKFRDYYLVREGISRMLMFRAPPEVLAALRSDKRALAICAELLPKTYEERMDWAWKEQYVTRLINDRI